MRRPAVLAACLLVLGPGASAEGVNNLLAGVNGLATFAADPVMGVVEPPEDFQDLPGAQVTGRIAGLGAGTVMCAYRGTMAMLDIVFFPFWVFPTLSPEPRWELIKDVEYE